MWWVYLVRTARGHLYCGVSTDVVRRVKQHNGELDGGAKALRGQRPVQLVWSLEVGSRGAAQRLEVQVKKLTHTAKEEVLAGIRSVETLPRRKHG